jgi:hypothetical protein
MADQTDNGNPVRRRRVPRTRTSSNATVYGPDGSLLPNTRNTRVVLGMNVPDVTIISSPVTLRPSNPNERRPEVPRGTPQPLPPGVTIETRDVKVFKGPRKEGRRLRNRSEAARKAAITRRARGR